MDWLSSAVEPPHQGYYQKAFNRQQQLTKPPGSLGLLEDIAIRLASMQQTDTPLLDRVWVSVFAADHGIAEEAVSAFPQSVTTEMVKNFVNKGAAINSLSSYIKAEFEVIDVGLVENINLARVIIEKAGSGTANFAIQAAMTEKQMLAALLTGKNAVERALKQNSQLFIGGEMGIANTTSASAIAVVLTGLPINELTGIGTGISSQQLINKVKVIENAILLHTKFLETPLKILQYVGGFEIAALVGAYIFSAQQGLPVLIDGFIASVAALLAININPEIQAWFFYGHCSQEKGHKLVLEHLKVRPLLNLDMRLGEASGAVVAVPLLQMACKIHNEMATFKEASISGGLTE